VIIGTNYDENSISLNLNPIKNNHNEENYKKIFLNSKNCKESSQTLQNFFEVYFNEKKKFNFSQYPKMCFDVLKLINELKENEKYIFSIKDLIKKNENLKKKKKKSKKRKKKKGKKFIEQKL
jgi:hypothetical protein